MSSPTSGSMRLPDAPARKTATTDFENNIVVVAGAGTGKTSLLVERFLNAIGEGRVEIDEVAAITFTEKASAELRLRVTEGLEQIRAASRGETPPHPASAAGRALVHLANVAGIETREIGRRALAALERLDHAKITTIHGFCSELLRAHPVEAGVDPGFSVDTGEQAAALCESAWEEFIPRELEADSSRRDLWSRLLGRFDMSQLAEIARKLGDFGIPAGLLVDSKAAPAAREILASRAAALAERVRSLRQRASGMKESNRRFFEVAERALAALADGGLEAFRAELPDPSAIPKANPSAGKKVTGVPPAEVAELGRECRTLLDLLTECDEAPMADLVQGLGPFVDGFREQLLRRGWVSFDGLLLLARDLLRDFPEVREDLRRRYRFLLVDEFQDTDPVQYEIVLFLAAQPTDRADDAYRARLEPGRLFVVGDPKQSIYRFRGADYTAFRRAILRIVQEGGRRLELTANFRSVAGITEPVNLLFEAGGPDCWQESPEYQPAYEPIRAMREQTDSDPRVELWTVDSHEFPKADERRHAEGHWIAEEIERLVRERRVCRFREISILFRAFSSIPAYLRPLRERGIPFVVDGGKDFLKRPEISQSLAVLRTLSQPSDPTALLAFLRSPAGGVSDTDLATFAESRRRWDWRDDVGTDCPERIAACFQMLQRLNRETRLLPADEKVRRVVRETHLLPLAAAAFEGPQRVANLQKLEAAAASLARDGRLSLEEVVDALQEGGLAELESDSPLADDLADAVHITSIHKMKGLENDRIFLPDLGREGRNAQKPAVDAGLTRLSDGTTALALRLGKLANPAWVLHHLEQGLHERAEEIRVLYVALTRARERLVLLGANPPRKPGPWLPALRAWGYDFRNPPADAARLCGDRVVHHAVRTGARPRRAAAKTEERGRASLTAYEEARVALARAAGPFRAPSAEAEEDRPAAPPLGARSREMGRAVGDVLHRVLESWDGERDERALATAGDLCGDVALRDGLDERKLRKQVEEIWRAFLDSPLAAAYCEVEVVGRELPLILRDTTSDRIYRGRIDLLYKDPSGALVVADYKTDANDDTNDLRDRYGGQLRVYAEAVERALELGATPRAELWMLRTGRRVEI